MFDLLPLLKEFTVEVTRERQWRSNSKVMIGPKEQVLFIACKYYSWLIPFAVPAGWFLGMFTEEPI